MLIPASKAPAWIQRSRVPSPSALPRLLCDRVDEGLAGAYADGCGQAHRPALPSEFLTALQLGARGFE
ncbi:hypothetical protein Shyhy02_73310 [Streptomyces hygroscopicus subsp. hygroscopicus]|nr:hypothetical protein Shyhy02_73310 [Streptomyces hygroscopicus subsp. hygroscopicus]